MPDIAPDLLRAFVAVAETGSFTAAAARIGRSQSAVSQKLLRLEELLNVRVFDRTSRSLTLTAEGDRALRAAKRLLEHYHAFVHEVGHSPTPQLLRLGVSENLLRTLLPGILSRFSKRFPNVEVELSTSSSQELLARYDAGALDLVIAKAGRSGSRSRGVVVWQEALAWVAAEEYQADGLCARLVVMRAPCAYRDVMTESLEQAGRELAIACTADNFAAVQAAVLAGLGVTVLGESLIQQGMKVLPPSTKWPALPGVEISVVGENSPMQPIFESLVSMLSDGVHERQHAPVGEE